MNDEIAKLKQKLYEEQVNTLPDGFLEINLEELREELLDVNAPCLEVDNGALMLINDLGIDPSYGKVKTLKEIKEWKSKLSAVDKLLTKIKERLEDEIVEDLQNAGLAGMKIEGVANLGLRTERFPKLYEDLPGFAASLDDIEMALQDRCWDQNEIDFIVAASKICRGLNLDYLKLVASEGIVKPTVNHNTLRAWYNNKMDEIESGDLPIEERQKQRDVLNKLFESYTRTKPTLRKV